MNAATDPVPRGAAGAMEIAFSIPEYYNCSEMLWHNIAAGRAKKIAIQCEDQAGPHADGDQLVIVSNR